jgi:phospholipase C
MLRMAMSVLLAMSISCNLGYPSAVRADDDLVRSDPAAKLATQTPIKHVVVIFDENNSFGHDFGTYPNALNLPGEDLDILSSAGYAPGQWTDPDFADE